MGVLNYIHSEKWNRKFDIILKTVPVIHEDILWKLNEAYSLRTADSARWLTDKLHILRDRVDRGDNFYLEGFGLLNKNSFGVFISRHYPDAEIQILGTGGDNQNEAAV